ncbi:hypothetical protein [Priestia megaterium]
MKAFIGVILALLLVGFLLVIDFIFWGLIVFILMVGIEMISMLTGHDLFIDAGVFWLYWILISSLIFLLRRFI